MTEFWGTDFLIYVKTSSVRTHFHGERDLTRGPGQDVHLAVFFPKKIKTNTS